MTCATTPLVIELPWPPSDNRLTRHRCLPVKKGSGRDWMAVAYPSEEAKEYQAKVDAILFDLALPRLSGPLRVEIDYYPPNRRMIDGPNRHKALQDSLKRREVGRRKKGFPPAWDPKQKAWLFATDDSQVVEWSGRLCHVVPGGKAVVTLTAVAGAAVQESLLADDDDDCPPPDGE
jgi:hypothetical protein